MSQKLTAEAINELAPNAQYTIIDGVIDWQSKDIDKPSDKDIEAKKTELAYRDERASKYPSIADQLDDIYHNGIDGWKASIKKIKDDNPKG